MSETNKSIKGFHARTLLASIANGEQPCSESKELAAQNLLPDINDEACLGEEEKANLAETLKKIAELCDTFSLHSEVEADRLIRNLVAQINSSRVDCNNCLSAEFCSKFNTDNPEV